MDIALSVAAFLLSLIGIAGCILPVIPGVVLSYAGLLCAAMCSYSTLSSGVLWIFLAVTVVVSAVDYFLPAYMTRLFGGSRAGAIGATIGVVVGLFMGGTGSKLAATVAMQVYEWADTYPVVRDWVTTTF